MKRQLKHAKSSPSDGEGRPARRRWRRIVWRTFLGLCLFLSITLGVIVYLLRSQPDYWKQHRAFLRSHTKQQLEALAQGAERRLEALSLADEDSPDNPFYSADSPGRSRGASPVEAGQVGASVASGIEATASSQEDPQGQPGEPERDRAGDSDQSRRTLIKRDALTPASNPELLEALRVLPENIRMDVTGRFFVSEDEMRALVAQRLEQWMDSRGYVLNPAIRDPMVMIDEDSLLLAFEVVTPYVSQVFSARFDLAFLSDGMARLELSQVHAGRLPLPADGIGWYLREQSPDNKRVVSLARWLDKLHDLRFKPVIEIAHRRRARVQRVEVLESGIRATVRIQDYLTYKQTNQTFAAVEASSE